MENEGKELELWVRSRAPFDEFGHVLGEGPFHGDGDDATFNTDRNETSRLFFVATVDTHTMTVADANASSSGTTNMSTEAFAKVTPTYHAEMQQHDATLDFGYEGSNPLVPLAPDIEIDGKLTFKNNDDGSLHISGTLIGEGFPATEAFVHFDGSKAEGVMLGSSSIKAETDKDYGTTQLFDLHLPFMREEIMNINLSIEFEGKTPVAVIDIDANKTYSVQEWNAIHANKPMVDCIQNVDNHVTIPDTQECINDVVEIDTSKNMLEGIVFTDKGVVMSGEYTKSDEDIKENKQEQTNTQPFDSTAKAQEILETANLNDFSQANENDYVMEMD